MEVLITICGRAGSKGAKNKNFRLFLGKPLIYYTIKSAKLFKKNSTDLNIDICINSDNLIAKEIAEEEKITFIERPNELAMDKTPKVDAIRDVLIKMEKNKNKKYDYVIDLDITAPLRKTQDIRSAFEQIVSTKVDVVFSVVPARRNPYFNMVERDEKGKIVFSKPVAYTCRQDAPEVYDMNASIYCYDRNTLIDTSKDPFDEKIEIIIMPEVYVVDIDHEEDFNVMECLVKNYYKDEFKEIFL
ncbi:cytidylyltransferase domain-containing protein [Fusobacterium polymorphum]|jgi:acylneuraminate cytidylyltransferase|uniref:CMP-N-acetylneuraminic acid synthetase n=1 Tax=Fusobacterium nucleatum subsp. polymorphum TaxID=76857 RepID=A0A2C6BSJ0_FUSNP|nr:acylneuraminate cytidylyltransferase family protein [Fusobacterium polymorphum]PHI07084.1 CMP-N-acetylneuraminic acid synthetase [Fusobacterium polymorphum]PIM75758.1 acylneuraminate cytidylyltransferase family protein [Fusobacterium polymorphum]WRL78675.1 acylneuraminate cytidylyltransferase family protein [Fusobacterium polymorphum]